MRIDNVISSSQIIKYNPIIRETTKIQLQYLKLLKDYIKKFGLNNRKIVKSQMQIYKKLLSGSNIKTEANFPFTEKYKYLIVFDFLFITAFDVDSEKNISALSTIIKESHFEKFMLPNIISYCSGNVKAWKNIERSAAYELFPEYLSLFKENFEFIKRRKFKILITATMSAGKSTLINALCGKNVTLSQNMACTSQLHSIFGKPFEDNYVCESDYELSIDAGNSELLNDNAKN